MKVQMVHVTWFSGNAVSGSDNMWQILQPETPEKFVEDYILNIIKDNEASEDLAMDSRRRAAIQSHFSKMPLQRGLTTLSPTQIEGLCGPGEDYGEQIAIWIH